MKLVYGTLLISLLLASLTLAVGVPAAKSVDPNLEFGVNYLATSYHYDPLYYLSGNTLEKDFTLFKQQGLTYITLVAVWKYLEPSMGNYNRLALDDLRRVCKFAANHSLQVIIDFHTLMFANSPKIPEWVSPRRFQTVFTNATVRQAWLNFLNYTAFYLNDVENICSWHMMNEPALGSWACDVSINEFLQLWSEMKAVFKLHSSRPVSIRFAAYVFYSPLHFKNCTSQIYDICDYVSLNWYNESRCPPEQLADMVGEIHQHNRTVMISEFGYNKTNDDHLQASAYREYLKLFREIGVSSCIAWLWRGDSDRGIVGQQPDPPGTGFNTAKNVTGTVSNPRIAFYLLKNSISELVIYIRADGSVDPSTSSVLTSDSIHYVLTSDTSHSIVVERSSITIDGKGLTLQGPGDGYGVDLVGVEGATIKNMNINGFHVGVLLHESSSNNVINGNSIENNDYGIWLEGSSNNNLVTGNDIMGNKYDGTVLIDSPNNTFYHNNFANTPQVDDHLGSISIWDDGYPSGGNYWSDYTGVDGNGDGIGDSPYIIDGNNQDNYPLIHSFISGDCNHDGTVNIKDASQLGVYWGKTVPPAPANVDINGDGVINIKDAAIVGINWQKHA